MEYFMMQPPFENVVFKEMKNKVAQAYFDWYIAEIPIRIEMLKKIVEEEANIQLDYSTNSLIALWEWYEDKILLVERDKALYQKALDNAPEWFKPFVSDKFLSYDTLTYAMDIAIYYGELIIKNNSHYFTKPKSRSGVNEPTLLGLPGNDDLNPMEIIYNLTQRSAKEKDKNRLLSNYTVWLSYF